MFRLLFSYEIHYSFILFTDSYCGLRRATFNFLPSKTTLQQFLLYYLPHFSLIGNNISTNILDKTELGQNETPVNDMAIQSVQSGI